MYLLSQSFFLAVSISNCLFIMILFLKILSIILIKLLLFLSVNIIFLFFLLKLFTSAILVETTGIPKDRYSFNLQALTEFVKSLTK